MPYNKREYGRYHPLIWDGDGEPCAHYVNGHVTPEKFHSAIAAHFGNSTNRPIIPRDAVIKHIYVRSARVENDDWGNHQHQWRHTSKKHGFPMTYWEILPNRNTGD